MNTYITPYLNLLEPPTTYDEGTWKNKKNFQELNNTKKSYDSSYVRFYLSDGASVTSRINTDSRVIMYIDINGDAKPNKVGRDIFEVNYCIVKSTSCVEQGTFIPNAVNKSRQDLLSTKDSFNCNKKKTGYRCLAVIMKDSWTIANDYPW